VVRYVDHETGATLDHLALLGHPDPNTAPPNLLRVENPDAARWYARAVCAALGKGHDVRVHARCATENGYDVASRGERNMCR
jgi:hypothetical protein